MTSQPQISPQEALRLVVEDLYSRQATGRGVIAIELAQEVIAATLEQGSRQQNDVTVSNVRLELFEDAALFKCRVKVHGRAFPPRPPVDTEVSLGVRDITHSEVGASGAVMFRVEQPLKFSSKLADMLIGLLGKALRKMPVSVDALRHKDSLVTLDFAALVSAARPDLAASAKQIRLYGLKVKLGSAWVQIGFVRT